MKKNHFKIGGNALSVILSMICATPMLAQVGKTVHGTVKEQSISLSGVLVTEKGTENHTFTDDDGRYDITLVTPNATLVFETPELLVREEEVKNRSSISIEFDTEGIGLQEVVVNAGYYTVKDKERTGSIARVTAKEIENQPVNNVLSAIQGRMAGVSIVQNSGVAGGGYDIQIRGRNSLRADGNNPLYIVDGMVLNSEVNSQFSTGILPNHSINPLNNINPNDIESIEVLKDADATAIYGSRGANGVILITTKNGYSGKTNFEISSNYNISSIANKFKLLNTADYIKMRKEAFNNDGITVYPNNAYDVNGTWDENRYTDWQKLLIGGISINNGVNLSLSGGNSTTTYLISGSHREETTVFPGKYIYKTNQLLSKITHRSKDDRFKLSFSNQLSFQTNNLPNNDITTKSFLLAPNAPNLYDLNGELNWENNTFDNPMSGFNSNYLNDGKQFHYNLNLNYSLFKNFKILLNSGISSLSFEEFSLIPHTIYNPSFGMNSNNSISYYSKDTKISSLIEPQMNWNIDINKHHLDILLGGSYQETNSRQHAISGVGFENNAFIQNLAAAKTKNISAFNDYEYKYIAGFGRINYSFDTRYIINLTARRDGSSRFGPNNRFANFGAVGAAWIFSKESFLKNNDWLSFGKLRGSFGITGNDNIGDFQFLDTYKVNTISYNNIVGLSPSRLYNPNFSWEKTNKLEFALEMAFLRNRLNFNLGYYVNRSSNQLVGIPLPATAGFTSVQSNLPATLENRGLEIELSSHLIKNSKINWKTDFNLSVPNDKLISFPNLESSTYANRYVVGQSINIVKVYEYEGIDKNTGLYTFKDYNGDGAITLVDDAKSIQKIGIKYFGGWKNQITYGPLDFSFLFQFVNQRNWNYLKQQLVVGSFNNQPNYVISDGDKYMSFTSGMNGIKNNNHVNYTNSTAAIGDASYIRLKNIQLNYRIPINSSVINDLVVYFQGQNLWTLTNYFGIDPEFTSIGYLPPLKTYSLGFQLKF